ncbi:uncharacterized protein LOC142355003, partial [Convolutriloba macropyga]|uniref:uncharacterized protein LOC142355003 n=1 Tax=Convolutriloba macropyga TaxID=536237 RepID=UPI003F51B497
MLEDLRVETGDFADPFKIKKWHAVARYLVPQRFKCDSRPCSHDIALILLKSPIDFVSSENFLPLCHEKASFGAMMGSCGLGTTSLIDMKDYTPSLHEVFFQESDFFDAERVDGIP